MKTGLKMSFVIIWKCFVAIFPAIISTYNFTLRFYRITEYMITRMTFYKINLLLLTVLVLFVGCSSEGGEERRSLKKKSVPETSVFLEADSTNDIGMPTWIKATSNSVFFFD